MNETGGAKREMVFATDAEPEFVASTTGARYRIRQRKAKGRFVIEPVRTIEEETEIVYGRRISQTAPEAS